MPADESRRRGANTAIVSARAALLQALARGDGFGLGLADRLRAATGGAIDLADGSVYPALRELERDGLVEDAGEEPRGDRGGRPRKLYRITPAGLVEAARQREALAALMAMADGRRERCGTPTSTPGDRWVVRDGEDVEEGDGIEPT